MKLEKISSILNLLGYMLESEQPHISGERFLMAKNKLVLIATRKSDHKKVVVKTSNNLEGKKEIENEKKARDLLSAVVFSDDVILLPKEIYFGHHEEFIIWITEFISQEKVFVAHDLEEQFFLTLRAFEEQESYHATTFEHLKSIDKLFPVLHAREYFDEFKRFKESVKKIKIKNLDETLEKAEKLLISNKQNIDAFSNYLTHTDFVPHNFRVRGRQIYMLDCSPEYRTLHFGNKYEGWARFLNYMVIHNPSLEKLLSNYVRKNRGESDYLSLKLMRIYKIGFLLEYYADSLKKTSDDLKELTLERINFWHEILKYIIEDRRIPDELTEMYKNKRDSLRSEEEKKRQREFAVA